LSSGEPNEPWVPETEEELRQWQAEQARQDQEIEARWRVSQHEFAERESETGDRVSRIMGNMAALSAGSIVVLTAFTADAELQAAETLMAAVSSFVLAIILSVVYQRQIIEFGRALHRRASTDGFNWENERWHVRPFTMGIIVLVEYVSFFGGIVLLTIYAGFNIL
jgi:hypothetical protein